MFLKFSDGCFNYDFHLIKSFIIGYLLYYAEARNELARPTSASLRPVNTGSIEEMLQRWRAVVNTVSDLTGVRFEPQTSRSRDERVPARQENIVSGSDVYLVFIYSLSQQQRLGSWV